MSGSSGTSSGPRSSASALTGQTSWQTSQPKIQSPMAAASHGVEDAGVLDRQVADAAPRVDRARRDERPGRAAGEAPRARPAGRANRFVGRQLGRGEDRAEEDPRAGTLVGQQVRVLADPAEAAAGGECALGQRPVVDVGDLARRQPRRPQVGGERLEPPAQRDVVVGAERVAGDPPGRLGGLPREHRRERPLERAGIGVPRGALGTRVRRGDDDDRARLRIMAARIGRLRRPLATHPVHARHAPGGDARLHPCTVVGQRLGARHADAARSPWRAASSASAPARLRDAHLIPLGAGPRTRAARRSGRSPTSRAASATRGMRKPKTEPAPASMFAAAQMRPPCASMMARLMYSPRPRPPKRRRAGVAIGLVEALEDVVAMLGRDPDAGVGDAHLDLAAAALRD